MNKTRCSLLVSLMIFFLTGCFHPVKNPTISRTETGITPIVLSEDITEIVKDDIPQKEGYVTFWFDDGLLSTYEIAYPLLTEKNWKGVVAVVSNHSIAQEKFNPDGDPVMSWEQVGELVDSGWELSSHSRTHPKMNEITEENVLKEEIIGSKEDLEERNFQVHSFTYPYGQNGRQSGQQMISNNYLYWRSSFEEINPVPAWRHITTFVLSEEVKREDLEEWVEQTEATNGWLVIMLHGIVDNPNNIWQHTREQFNMVLDIVENSSLEVVLPNEMYERFGYAEGETPTLHREEIFNPSTIGIDSFKEDVFLQIPNLEIDTNLALVCKQENVYDFSVLHEAPIWICPEASPYLTDIGDYGASIILGHRQWGPVPKVFAKLDLLQKNDMVSVKNSEESIDFKVFETVEIEPKELWQIIADYHVLGEENERSFLILVTCTPYGTARYRLLVVLERNKYE
jgi:LPXTG-site transpeptidase (sortase) family protein